MFYTYILLCNDNRYYTGYTHDLKNHLPVKLIYYEACINEEDARRREKTLKSGRGKTYIKKRLKRFFQCSGFGE